MRTHAHAHPVSHRLWGRMVRTWAAGGILGLAGLGASLAWASPHQPLSDNDILETLPQQSASRAEARRLRQQLARQPQDAATAVALARAYLDQAHQEGDARLAGLGLGALSAWQNLRPESGQVPTEVLVTHGTIAQYLHDFDGAARRLQQALKQDPRHAQAWITLATVRRVQGRYAESSQACEGLKAAGNTVYAAACLAENQSLRGQQASARQTLQGLLKQAEAQGAQGSGLRQWLWTTLAELEERAGQPQAAEAAWQQALAEGREGYVLSAWADFLLHQQRPREVLALLASRADATRSDALLLRLAVAATQAADPRAAGWRGLLQSRFEASAARPEASRVHAREQARFALTVRQSPTEALALAQANLQTQREPADLLLMAEVARAQPNTATRQQALQNLQTLSRQLGVHDARLALP
ncbi:tetratricopeptide repeat protein [Aquabacterium sp.]|uniref:tetratricopeptide repeat protein n=1 Tax=Aquabacterium sp. TaxID=1872578 RepID=UPI0025BE5986|nr:tetratricopeptide repeat protein [Aquabacterium sp.]